MSPQGIAVAQVVAVDSGQAAVAVTVGDSDVGDLVFDVAVNPYGPASLLVGESFDLAILAAPPEPISVDWSASDAAVLRVVERSEDSATITARRTGGTQRWPG